MFTIILQRKLRRISQIVSIEFICRNYGDWIIQKVFANSSFIQRLVTPNAPLSTVRIITSREASSSLIKVKAMVFRAGRVNQMTDHNAIFIGIKPV